MKIFSLRAAKQNAFTLTEIIVSIVVLGLITGGAVRTFGTALHLHEQNELRLTAAYLVQDCLENIRNKRDTNWLQNKAWNEGLTDIEPPFDTRFARSITPKILQETTLARIETDPNPDENTFPTETEFTCSVSWENGSASLSASSILTRWQ